MMDLNGCANVGCYEYEAAYSPSEWIERFSCTDKLLCILDRPQSEFL